MAILLGGALTGVLAVCAIAGLFILKNASGGPTSLDKLTPREQQSAVANSGPAFVPFDVAPDACKVLGDGVGEKIVPGSNATDMLGIENDRESKCGWGDIGRSDPRELTVELRAEVGGDPVATADALFVKEWDADKSGDNLLSGDKLVHSDELEKTGEAAYELYIVRRSYAEAVVNARVGNVLITVRYGGRSSENKPLSEDKALDVARDTAKIVAATLAKGPEAQAS